MTPPTQAPPAAHPAHPGSAASAADSAHAARSTWRQAAVGAGASIRRQTTSLGRADRGSATVWLLLLVPALVFGAGLVVDGGRAITARQEAVGLAAEAARAAVDQMDVTSYRTGGGARAVAPGAAQAAACGWTAKYRPDAGCTASVAARGRVEVTVTLIYRPVILGAVGVGPRVVSASAQARPAIGDATEVGAP